MSVLCILVLGSDSSPAVPEQALQDIRWPWRAEDRPLDASVFEVAAVDLVGTEPLFDSLLDAVALGEAHGARSWGETVIHKVHRVLNGDKRETVEGGEGKKRVRLLNLFKYVHKDFHLKQIKKTARHFAVCKERTSYLKT